VREIQHGHLYMRWDDFGSKTIPVLKAPAVDWTVSASVCSQAPSPSISPQRSTPQQIAFHRSFRSAGQASKFGSGIASEVTDSDPLGSTPPSASPMRSSGIRSRQMRQYTSHRATGFVSESEDWSPLPYLRSHEDLEDTLRFYNLSHLADNEEMVSQLLAMATKGQELIIEANQERRLRCRGILVHLVVELAAPEEETDAPAKVLVQTGVQASAACDNEDDQEIVRMHDPRVLTVLCAHHETWNTALARYCQQVFQLSDTAVSRLIAGCLESADDDTFSFRATHATSVCFQHEAAFIRHGLPVVYDAIRLKTTIHDKDRQMFGSFMNTSFRTTEQHASLQGFAGMSQYVSVGVLTREWTWIPETAAMDMQLFGCIAGLDRPCDFRPLQLAKETKRLGSLLIGIESSAPLKEDLFGNTHNIDAKSKDRSAFGKPKWRAYGKGGHEVPADLGGIKVTVDEDAFSFFRHVCRIAGCHKPSSRDVPEKELEEERRLFRELLQEDDEGVEQVLVEYLEAKGIVLPEMLHEHVESAMVDDCARATWM